MRISVDAGGVHVSVRLTAREGYQVAELTKALVDKLQSVSIDTAPLDLSLYASRPASGGEREKGGRGLMENS